MVRTISMPKFYIERLRKEKEETGQNISEVIRRALDVYFERKTKPIVYELKERNSD